MPRAGAGWHSEQRKPENSVPRETVSVRARRSSEVRIGQPAWTALVGKDATQLYALIASMLSVPVSGSASSLT